MLDSLSGSANWVAAIAGGVSGLILLWKVIIPRLAMFYAKINQVFDVMLGRDEIRHPETGQILAEATPPLGTRFAAIEEAIIRLSDSHTELVELTKRIERIEARVFDDPDDRHLF